MKLEKKHWMIIGVIALIAIWYFFLRKKKPAESGYNPYILVPGEGMWGNESGYIKRSNTSGAPAERKFNYYKSGSGACFHKCEELPAAGGGVICKCPTE
jgi:hypothetical protein